MICDQAVGRLFAVLFFSILGVGLAAKCGAGEVGSPTREKTLGFDPDFIVFGLGGFDVNDNEKAGQFEVQARFQKRIWFFKPQIGAFVTTKSGFYAYGGGSVDLFLGRRYVVSPSFAVGFYQKGDGKELGGDLEFRSALEIAYRLRNRARIGLQVGHLSNASIFDANPGTEFAIINYSFPTDVFSR
ncbi:MAG: deacylase [Rhodospirillaceae bacterium]|nr:deacylase [Rhodospirillaceae bacterium]|tara:strand:+ start:231 stop:788 length:558 start_codon:yes stop_codon:yes gene_type:complete